MRKVLQILTVGLSVALLQIFAQGAQAKMKSAAALMSSPAVQAAKGIHPIVQLSGCVHQAQTGNPLSTAACKYITMNGVNYSAAVLSETPVAEFYKIPSAQPIPPNTSVSAVAATLDGPSWNCLGAEVKVTGSVVLIWKPTGQTCPAK